MTRLRKFTRQRFTHRGTARVRRPTRAAEHRVPGLPSIAVGSVQYRRSCGWPLGVGGEDVACTERPGRRTSVHLAAAADYRSPRKPEQRSADRAEPGHALPWRARHRRGERDRLEPRHRRLLLAEAATGVLQAVRHRLRGAGEPDPMPAAAASMNGPVPHTVFDAPLTKRRAVAFASIPLANLKIVNNAFGGSIANAFLAACTLSLRRLAATPRHHARRSTADAGAASSCLPPIPPQ